MQNQIDSKAHELRWTASPKWDDSYWSAGAFFAWSWIGCCGIASKRLQLVIGRTSTANHKKSPAARLDDSVRNLMSLVKSSCRNYAGPKRLSLYFGFSWVYSMEKSVFSDILSLNFCTHTCLWPSGQKIYSKFPLLPHNYHRSSDFIPFSHG